MKVLEIKNNLNKAIYSGLVKKICFKFDEEKVHNFFTNFGRRAGKNQLSKKIARNLFSYQNPILEQNLCGITFKNPIGLSAGFDKNAELISIMGDVGFGFSEIGSITAKPCMGNSGKRLLRIPEKKSIWVNLGLNNGGADKISSKLSGKIFEIPFGINIAKTNCRETTNSAEGIKDYIYSLKKFNEKNIGDYFTINISCPNAYDGQPFSNPKLYEKLIKEVKKLKIKKPVFIKLSPDLEKKDLDKILKISKKYGINGFICSNLSKKDNGFEEGGLSGKEVYEKSNSLLSYVYKKTRVWKNKPVLIGVGGIFKAEDAYEKIKLGANLVQIITGMIFQGPNLIGEINYKLAKFLERDGFSNIREAAGSGYQKTL